MPVRWCRIKTPVLAATVPIGTPDACRNGAGLRRQIPTVTAPPYPASRGTYSGIAFPSMPIMTAPVSASSLPSAKSRIDRAESSGSPGA